MHVPCSLTCNCVMSSRRMDVQVATAARLGGMHIKSHWHSVLVLRPDAQSDTSYSYGCRVVHLCDADVQYWMDGGGILFLKHGIHFYFHLFRTAAAKRNGWKIAALEQQLNNLPPAAVRPAPPTPPSPSAPSQDAEGRISVLEANVAERRGGGEEYARGDRFCPCTALYFPFCPLP